VQFQVPQALVKEFQEVQSKVLQLTSVAVTVATPIEVQFQNEQVFPFQDVQFRTPLQYLSKLSPPVPELHPLQFHELHKELLKDLQANPPEQ
jgi:hypothetical protein